jgi:hypothetical protein
MYAILCVRSELLPESALYELSRSRSQKYVGITTSFGKTIVITRFGESVSEMS